MRDEFNCFTFLDANLEVASTYAGDYLYCFDSSFFHSEDTFETLCATDCGKLVK